MTKKFSYVVSITIGPNIPGPIEVIDTVWSFQIADRVIDAVVINLLALNRVKADVQATLQNLRQQSNRLGRWLNWRLVPVYFIP